MVEPSNRIWTEAVTEGREHPGSVTERVAFLHQGIEEIRRTTSTTVAESFRLLAKVDRLLDRPKGERPPS